MASSYKDLLVWQRSIGLVKKVYKLTQNFPANEQYGLTSQLRRSIVSVPSNIAEGQARQSNAEFRRFLAISLGSLAEADTQIIIAFELGYISKDESQKLSDEITQIRRMMYGLRKKLSTNN